MLYSFLSVFPQYKATGGGGRLTSARTVASGVVFVQLESNLANTSQQTRSPNARKLMPETLEVQGYSRHSYWRCSCAPAGRCGARSSPPDPSEAQLRCNREEIEPYLRSYETPERHVYKLWELPGWCWCCPPSSKVSRAQQVGTRPRLMVVRKD